MFFLRHLTREMQLPPNLHARGMTQELKEKLYQDVEGSCNGEFYTICILDVTDISKGRVLPGVAAATFTLSYRAIVWKPFRGETIDCMVTKVNRTGIFCDAGPLSTFVAQTNMKAGMTYNPDTTPVQFSNSRGDEIIEKGSAVRIEIMGLRSDVEAIMAIGKMADSWFGENITNLSKPLQTGQDPTKNTAHVKSVAMTLKTVYERFLASPNPISLSEDASLNYVTTLKTFAKPEPLIRHLENQNRNEVRKKAERVIAAVEGQSSLSLDVETTFEFVTGGGAYLPGLENFVTDRIVTLPSIHIVNFDAEDKIQRIRIYWDQGSLLRQVDVIGSRGRNWPITDGTEQCRLIKSVLAGSKFEVPVTQARDAAGSPTAARSVSPSKKRIQDPHTSLDLFNVQEQEPTSRKSQPAIIAPRTSAKPAEREYSELFAAGHEDFEPGKDGSVSPKKPPAESVIAPKGAGSTKFQPSRLFDENATEDRPAGYKSDPAKYNHFDLGEGIEDDHFQHKKSTVAKMVPMRAKTNKHMSQWDFEDCMTPEKAGGRVRGQDIRHFGWSDDEGEKAETPGKQPRLAQSRPDAQAQFEFQDDGTPDANRLTRAVRQKGTAHNSGLGLYQNNVYNDDDENTMSKRSGCEKEPLTSVTTNVGRSKNMARHWTISDSSPVGEDRVNNENRPLGDNKKKAVQVMDANWASYDHSPQQNNSKGGASKPLRKGMESHWGFGNENNMQTATANGSKEDKNFWDF